MAGLLRALNRTIKSLEADGRLTEDDEALKALAKALARAVDADPCDECGAARNAALWREYRAAVGALMEAGERDGNDDDTADFIVSIRRPNAGAPLGDPEISEP